MTQPPRHRPTALGRRIRAARLEAKLSQEHLAVQAHVRWITVYRIESGEVKNPNWHTVVALADALRLSLDYLAGYRQEHVA